MLGLTGVCCVAVTVDQYGISMEDSVVRLKRVWKVSTHATLSPCYWDRVWCHYLKALSSHLKGKQHIFSVIPK